MALRGDGDGADNNFLQLLQLKAEEDPAVLEWLKQKTGKYTSPKVQNDLLKVMAMLVMRDIRSCMQQSPFLALMMDETTDISNNEQTALLSFAG